MDTSLPYASVVEEYSNGTLAARYDYGDDLVRMDRGSGVYYYLYDGLGSTRQLVNTGGAVTDTWGYSAFGELASHTGTTANPFLFNAQQFDGASGNYYLRARYYDQSAGRFIGQDPYSGSDYDPVTLHRYLYANVDPTGWADPSGAAANDLALVGTQVHNVIGADFILNNPQRLSNTAINTLLNVTGLSILRPDLADLGTNVLFEIKPDNVRQISAGLVQLGTYNGGRSLRPMQRAAAHRGGMAPLTIIIICQSLFMVSQRVIPQLSYHRF